MSNPDPILPIVLTVTVYAPKKGVRKVVVSGAPEGEMPLFLAGAFQERHVLLDQAYAQCLKRDPQLVTIAEPKVKPGKANSITAGAEEEDGETAVQGDGASDQLVGEIEPAPQPSPLNGEGDEELPAIEGDSAAQLSAISSSAEPGELSTLEEQILEWKEEDHGQQD